MSTFRILLLLVAACFAAEPRGLSVGMATGGISGGFGFSGRYWQQHWGIQASAFPFIRYSDVEDQKFLMASVHALHRFDTPPASLLHEQGGYVYSSFYQYFGSGLLYGNTKSEYDDYTNLFSGIGGGVGVETFWRNWRLATGVGLALYLFRSTDNPMDGMVFPTLDITLGYGF